MANDGGAVAALDCGTNSTRLLIADGGGRVLEREMRITRLGEGVDATHRLSAEAIGRTVAVLEDYRKMMGDHGVGRARLVATSAARDAANADQFLARAEEATGVAPELLSGPEEGRLSFAGATATLPAGDRGGPVLVVDIGGGSTELVVGTVPASPAGGAEAGPIDAISLDIGCVRITERFFHHDPPSADERRAAEAEVARQMARARSALPALAPDGLLIGLAGTVSTLAALELGLAHYDRDRIHHALLSADQVEGWLARLAGEDRAARLRRPGMVEGRADVIVGGVLVLAAAMAGFGRDRCLVSEDDILDGLVATLL
jgi:exopolyphosphatase/guanosine-5'-triphosphate,3'-diphosphate pyrophosphatase